ncbi:MAG: hypothetical protein Q8N94_04180 [Methanoregula sp.]|nr:hypothetical protein [Methanoregula sp.]
MEFLGKTREQRTRVIFFLILSVAVLWAMFLLQQGEILPFTFMFASLAAINPVVAFIDLKNPRRTRSLFFFYLLILVALVWAVFLLFLGVHVWVSLFLFIVAVGVPFILHVMESETEPSAL